MSTILNPKTGRYIKNGSKTHISLIKEGFLNEDSLIESENKSFETLLRERDPEYFDSIKNIIDKMPDIRKFESIEGRLSLSSWTLEKKYEYLLRDLETLDASSYIGRDKDLKFIKIINEKDNFDRMGYSFVLEEKDKELLEDGYNTSEFVELYPALSWILAITVPAFRVWALKYTSKPYQEWIADISRWADNVSMPKKERIAISEFVTNPEIMRILLHSINLDNRNLYDIATKSKNKTLLRHLAIYGPLPKVTDMWRFVRGGDVDSIKIILNRDKNNELIKKKLVENIIEANNIYMIEFLEELRGKKLMHSEILELFKNSLGVDNLYLVEWANKRGYSLHPNEIFEIMSLDHIEPEVIDYLLNYYDISIFKPYYVTSIPNIKTFENAFTYSVQNPKVFEYFIHKYGNNIIEENWINALNTAKEGYLYWNNISKNYSKAEKYKKSMNIIRKFYY